MAKEYGWTLDYILSLPKKQVLHMSRMISLRGIAESYLLDASSKKSSHGGEYKDSGDISNMSPAQLQKLGAKVK